MPNKKKILFLFSKISLLPFGISFIPTMDQNYLLPSVSPVDFVPNKFLKGKKKGENWEEKKIRLSGRGQRSSTIRSAPIKE